MNTMTRPAAVGGVALIWTWINEATSDMFGVDSVLVVLLAALGAYLSFSYVDDSKPNSKPISRKKLYLFTIINTLLAITCVAVLPAMLGWDWYSPKVEGSLAFIFAFAARYVAPLFLESLPEIFRKWFKIGEYKAVVQEKDKTDEGL